MYSAHREDFLVHRTERRKVSCLLRTRPMVWMTVAIFRIQRRIERLYYRKCTYVSCKSAHFSCQVLLKLESSPQIFRKKKHSNIKFHENPSSGSRVVPCGQTDRQTDMKLMDFFFLRTSLKIVSLPMPVYDYDAGSFASLSSLRVSGYYVRGNMIIVKLTIGELVMRR